jgi:Rha family phage regulatory protein
MNTQVQAIDYTSFVFEKNDDIKTDSFKIADKFGKRHDNVIRDIEAIVSSLTQLVTKNILAQDEVAKLNFEVCFKNNELQNGKPQKFYELNESAFMLVVMKYTGLDAMAIKTRYINAFNFMRDTLSKLPYGIQERLDELNCPVYLTPGMQEHVKELVRAESKRSGVHWQSIYIKLNGMFGGNKLETISVTRYPYICDYFGVAWREEIPQFLFVNGKEFKLFRDAYIELEQLKADPTPLLICSENEIWTKCTNDSVILPYVEFEKLTAARDESPKERIAKVLKQAFDEVDAGSENILVGRQRWNELNFIVKKVMNNPEALAIL